MRKSKDLIKQWEVAPPAPIHFINALSDIGAVLAQILYNRGITTPEDARRFLSGDLPLYDPFKMRGMNKAVFRIRTAIKRREPIVVYGDFDADGVTSTALLVQTLQALGADVQPYIPHRVDEGYGLNSPALRELAESGVRLVITVDCGIRSVEEVRDAMNLGLDVIVTDHHSIGDELPPAVAVIDPKQEDCEYPEDMLAGVGIAFKLASALLHVARSQDKLLPSLSEQDLLDLVAIGTVADLAPLDRFENRRLVQLGLKELAKAKRPGVYTLMDIAGIQPDKVNATSIGFALGPRINAAGRLESAFTAYQLLSTNDWQAATDLARELQAINVRRQELTKDAYEKARLMAQDMLDGDTHPTILFAASPEFLPGIVGLVAGRLVEEFYCPAVVVEMGEEEAHGSCRSIPEFNITRALDQCSDLLIRHGGHAQAAGFSIVNENLGALKKRLTKIAVSEIAHLDLRPLIKVDAQIRMSEITMNLAEKFQLLEPTGVDNPPPLLMMERLRVVDARTVGKDGEHLKLRLADGPIGIDAIAFRQGERLNRLPLLVDVAFHLEINEWNGRRTIQLNIVDIRPGEY